MSEQKTNPFLKKFSMEHVAPSFRPRFNIDPLYDIVTGNYIEGKNGEYILNGGWMNMTLIIGIGNAGKSTIFKGWMLRTMSHHPSFTIDEYDSESNTEIGRMVKLASFYPNLADRVTFLDGGMYRLSSINEMSGDKWYHHLKAVAKERSTDKSVIGTTPFVDLSDAKGNNIKVRYPMMAFLDSMTEFNPEVLVKKVDKHGPSDGQVNTIHMEGGKIKSNMLEELKYTLPPAGILFGMTGHLVDEINMTGQPVEKVLTHQKQGKKAKGIPSNARFLTQHYWSVSKVGVLLDSDNKGPLYPSSIRRNDEKNLDTDAYGKEKNTDLMAVTLTGIRNKSGLSGVPMTYIYSQEEGILFELTHFHCLKTHDYGLVQSGHTYVSPLCPDVKLGRTTVRDLVKENKQLARALEISVELCMYFKFHAGVPVGYRKPIEELCQMITEQGYSLSDILNTRGYWVFKEEEEYIPDVGKPYLSGYDFIRIAKGEYQPTWLKKTK